MNQKKCKRCGEVKDATEFSSGRGTCKPCRREIEKARYHVPAVKARHAIARRKWYAENRQMVLEQKSYYGKRDDVAKRDLARKKMRYQTQEAYRKVVKTRRDRYYANNAHVFRARDARRRALLLKATPKWADQKAIRSFYKLAELVTKETGIRHEVDHIVPLRGRNVSGLHVEMNLQVISRSENRRKFNKLVQDIV